MREITRFTWDYQGFETDAMACFIGTSDTFAGAVNLACGRARVQGWDTLGQGLGLPDLGQVMRVQIEAQREQWLVTLFVSDEMVVETRS